MRKAAFIILSSLLICAAAVADSAVLLDCSGTVSIARQGRTETAVKGMDLATGDIITTEGDGSALILFPDGSRIDLYSDSRLKLQAEQVGTGKKSSILGELWQSIKEKFSDSAYSSAQAGGVGALRAPSGEEQVSDRFLDARSRDEMEKALASVGSENLPARTKRLMDAILYEKYGQYREAEKIYLQLIDSEPGDSENYDMLMDLYLKIDCFGLAGDMAELKRDRLENR